MLFRSIAEVVTSYRALSAAPDVRQLYAKGERLHEVPFTMRETNAYVRGSVDCVVRESIDGREQLTILEFKTGRPRPEHRAQLDLYTRAVRALFPDASVEARLVYAEGGRDNRSAGKKPRF